MAPTAAVGTLSPVVKINGTELAATWLDGLVHASVDRGLGTVGRAQLRFLDAGFGLSSAAIFVIGAEVTVSVPRREGNLIKGVVTAVELQQSGVTSTPELVVTVDDRATRLAAAQRSRTFLNQTVQGVVSSVCQGVGLTCRVTGGSTTHPYLLQAGTDLAFLDHLVRRSGLVWWVDSQGVLQAGPAGSSTGQVSVELGVDLLAFSVRASASAPDKVTVTGWDQNQQASVSAEVTAESRKPGNTAPAFVKGATGRGKGRGWDTSALVASPPPIDSAEAKNLAGAMAAEAAAAAVTMSATCVVDPRLTPGVTLRVKGAGPAAGEYLLSRVEHVYNRTGFHSRVVSGPLRAAGIVDLLGGPGGVPDPGYSLTGVIPAIVTNADNGEKKGVGLVKVKYPAISGNVESTWARVLSLGAGPKRGAVFQPEVGDEVLVAFERGDTRRAVVLGGLFSEKVALPNADTVAGDKVQYRRITSRQGHVLEFNDGDGDNDQHVLLSSKKGAHKIRLGNDRLDLEVGNVPVLIRNGAGASIEFSANGDVTIKGKNVTIESTAGDATLKAVGNLTLKGSLALKAEATTVEVKGSASATLQASGQVAIKGAMVAIN